jgi:DMSO/TMAO reductase YedYZ molybdopterin-dependent catalytic subunit
VNPRRRFLGAAGAAGASVILPEWARAAVDLGPPELPAGFLETGIMDALPGKRPLIKKSFRPPNYETPVQYFNQAYTPNDVFFVRYHLADIPWIGRDAWTLTIAGDSAKTPYQLDFNALRTQFEIVEIDAVCMCSGNRRGLFEPHVPGVEWGHGAMGHARWKGVRLKDVLERAGVAKDAVEVAFDGADGPVLPKTPDFQKSLPIWRALDESVLLAFEMNGEPLPHWNGFPVRLVVPGWTATYWVKHVSSVRVLNKPFDNFWMKPAYRIPLNKFPLVNRFASQENEANTPITEMVVNSLITAPLPPYAAVVGRDVEVRGVAWDGGYGVTRVDVSLDGGQTWRAAELGRDMGRFAWRQWSFRFRPVAPGEHHVMVRAANKVGATQPAELIANPAGYHNNVIQKTTILAS